MTRYFIFNRISAFMLCASLLTAGIVSLTKLPVSLRPGTDCPALSVIIEYPGVTPDKIESLITRPVERIIKTVSGIEQIESVSEEGKSRINITFSDETDIKIAAVKIRGKIDLVSESFPREVQEPVVMRYDPSERPVIIAAAEINGVDRNGVREIMEKRVKPALQRVEGISEIVIAGGELQEIQIETDYSRCAGRSILPADIAMAVSSANLRLPCGSVEGTSGNMMINIPSGFRSLGEISSLTVMAEDGKSVKVSDLAVVRYGTREKEDLARFNGLDMVTLYIHRGAGVNTLELCTNIKQVIDSFPEISWHMIFNQGDHIEASLDNAVFSGVWGIIIVVIILTVFFRRTETVIPVAAGIPVIILTVPLFMYICGKSVNIMTISGFALTSGMVVDNGIVIMDAIKRRSVNTESIITAVNEMRLPVVASTFTAISVFLPVMLMSKKAGATYGDMAFTIVSALLFSLFFSVILLPSFYAFLKNRCDRNCRFMMIPQFLKSNKIADIEKKFLSLYMKVLGLSFKNSRRVLVSAAVAFFAALLIMSLMKNDHVPDSGSDDFYLYLEFPTGTSLEITDSYVVDVEKNLHTFQGVENVTSRVEKWRGTLTVKTDDTVSYASKLRLKQNIKNSADSIVHAGGGFAYISEADELASREISIHFIGDDYDTLRKIARDAASGIKNIDGIEECMLRFREGRPEYTIVTDRDAAGAAGVTHADIAESVRNFLFGPVITKYIDKDREVDVRVRFSAADRKSIDDIIKAPVRNEQGMLLPVSTVSAVSENSGLTRIFRLNGRRSCSITARTGSLSFQEAEGRISALLRSMNLPEGYTFEFDRRLKEFREEKKSIFLAAVTSILLIYIILASLFESFSLPLLILTGLPLALTGVVPLLFISGIPLSPEVFMGLIMLAGIVMNNGILLVEALHGAIVKEDDNSKSDDIIKKVAALRLRPVMITAVTAISGMIPMVLCTGEGSSIWRPFSITVASGLLFSTLLTLIVLPVMCTKYYNYRLRCKNDNTKKQ